MVIRVSMLQFHLHLSLSYCVGLSQEHLYTATHSVSVVHGVALLLPPGHCLSSRSLTTLVDVFSVSVVSSLTESLLSLFSFPPHRRVPQGAGHEVKPSMHSEELLTLDWLLYPLGILPLAE